MENRSEAIQHFEQFAEETLSNHVTELNAVYENEKIDKQTLQQAYWEHQKIGDKELGYKMQSLLSAESNSLLKGELENINHPYLSKLNLKNHESIFLNYKN